MTIAATAINDERGTPFRRTTLPKKGHCSYKLADRIIRTRERARRARRSRVGCLGQTKAKQPVRSRVPAADGDEEPHLPLLCRGYRNSRRAWAWEGDLADER